MKWKKKLTDINFSCKEWKKHSILKSTFQRQDKKCKGHKELAKLKLKLKVFAVERESTTQKTIYKKSIETNVQSIK